MGLLDDAIREHLDLKRARGGDPAEIERMEREALGPVRRDPTVGSGRFEDPDALTAQALEEPEFPEEHLTELEDLQELGYHDSTAPQPHHEHTHARDEHLKPRHNVDDAHAEQLESEPQELPPPKRRFLRRSRPASLAAPAAPPDPGFHQELPTEHHDLLEHPEPLAPEEPPEPAGSRPPLLRFEHPPKRPRFTAEPPSPEPESEEATESPDEPLGAAPIAPAPAPAAGPPPSSPPAQPAPEYEHFDEPPADDPDAETTEFDVQKHLAEPQGAPEGTDEDVLEETPEFLQDTPEHDRLWFEQRPPKDFDFNG